MYATIGTRLKFVVVQKLIIISIHIQSKKNENLFKFFLFYGPVESPVTIYFTAKFT